VRNKPPASRLERILSALEAHYGRVRVPPAARPYCLLLYANAGYPPSDRACEAGYAALEAKVGLSPDAILGAPKRRIVTALRVGGIVPELRADRVRAIAKSKATSSSDPDDIGHLPLAQARKLLKTFPTIGDPGADKILLFSRTEPTAAVPSNAHQVPLRLGFGNNAAGYAASYRSARTALDAELPRTFAARIRAYLLLRTHGEQICKRSKPLCDQCPVAQLCPSAPQGKDRGAHGGRV
jgi:endonuclease-3